MLLATAACSADRTSPGEIELGLRYTQELAFRREALERSLADAENDYARLRLARYAVVDGWERLPEQRPSVRIPGAPAEAPPEPLFQDDVPWTPEALLELGQRAFETWPAQVEPRLSTVLDDAVLGEHLGFVRDARGRPGALVIARFADGSELPALTCASCHGRIENGEIVHGKASDIDLGALLGSAGAEASWGAGRIDVTADELDNPVAIPDLRAVRHQRSLHWSANLDNGLIALAVRIETLLITASAETVRPPRQVAFALALFLRSLGEGERAPEPGSGGELFAQHCAPCHSGATGEGEPRAAAEVGTDPLATLSPERGTGSYRVPSLWRVAERTRLTHEGRFPDLEALLDPSRSERDSAHPYGLRLTAPDRSALLEYVHSL